MRISTTMIVSAVAFAACATAFAQNRINRSFSATGATCSQVTWSQESLALYPRIASACEEVMQRDGKYYVRFHGEVERVADRGQLVTISFRDGDRLTLTPPENMALFMNGQRTPVNQLRPGDQLNFYVPQDQLAASFFEGDAATAPLPTQQVPITPAAPEPGLLAQNQPASGAQLPRTASVLPMVGLVGLMLIGLGGVLTMRRWVGRSS